MAVTVAKGPMLARCSRVLLLQCGGTGLGRDGTRGVGPDATTVNGRPDPIGQTDQPSRRHILRATIAPASPSTPPTWARTSG